LAEHFGSIDKLKEATVDQLTEICEIGPVVAASVYNFFNNKENLKILEKIERAGVKVSQTMRRPARQKLKGKTVVITGVLKSFSRSQAQELVRKLGGSVSSSVSKGTDILVCGDSPGSKLNKAKALGISVITEEEFKSLVS
jgi:DNA ligase (NAD+)